MKKLYFVLVAILLVSFALSSSAEEVPARTLKDPIMLDSGAIKGKVNENYDGVREYLGIPYAKPPVKELRWKLPQPLDKWDGVRECTEYGNSCPQPKSLLKPEKQPKSEDCLYLNVWTGAQSEDERRPVMFWIHGGGCTTGSGAQDAYKGGYLASKGMVVVTINYRLGPFGFFGHEKLSAESEDGVSGNYGFADQVFALQWVKRHIAAFGGDPENVTIFGESAGAVCVNCHLVSPMSKGLFHRAIMQSGTAVGINRKLDEHGRGGAEGRAASLYSVGSKISKKLGCAAEEDELKALREVPPDKLLEASNASVGLFGDGIKFNPVVDGHFIPDVPFELVKQGRVNKVPVIIGVNHDEGTIFLSQIKLFSPLAYKLLVRKMYGEDAAEILERFPANTKEEVKEQMNRIVTIQSFAVPALFMGENLADVGCDVYFYEFDRVFPSPYTRKYGAFHAAEILYVFGGILTDQRGEDTDQALSRRMSTHWMLFALSGNTNADTIDLNWPKFESKTGSYMYFGDEFDVKEGLHKEHLPIFEKIFRR
ncbi:MAG: carboxylesterase/lipase family protein [Planctomycetota bacterium]|nr:carboxylesterase/lipase family protein [Planctomycetota bacterium]